MPIATKEDIDKFRAFADLETGWSSAYDKPDVKVWDRSVRLSLLSSPPPWLVLMRACR